MAEKKDKKENKEKKSDEKDEKKESTGPKHFKGYSIPIDPEKTARALGRDLPISRKKSVELCRELRGMKLDEAKEYLEDIIKKKRAVPYRRYTSGAGHKRGHIGPGGYPVKAAKYILELLESAESNADYNGMDTDELYIKHIAAHPGRVYHGFMPRAHGRSTPWDTKTTTIEIVLESLEV
jgi:large subunit ribosomal protein L22